MNFLLLGEFDHAINLSRPKLIFASSIVAQRAVKIAEKNAFVNKIIVLNHKNGGKMPNKLITSYVDLMNTIPVSCYNYNLYSIYRISITFSNKINSI